MRTQLKFKLNDDYNQVIMISNTLPWVDQQWSTEAQKFMK